MERHRWDAPSGDMVRMIKYPPRPDEDDVNGPRMAGHTDFGSITLLFNQNVGLGAFRYRAIRIVCPSIYSNSSYYRFRSEAFKSCKTTSGNTSAPFPVESL